MLEYKKSSPYIIAEIGINHEGSVPRALRLILSAKKAGADAVKFQLFQPETLASKDTVKTKNQKKKIKKETLFQMWKRVSLNEKKIIILKKFSKKIKIDFFCSIFDYESLKIINKTKINSIKIASSDITDLPLLREVAKTKAKIFLSTGMANLKEISAAKNIFKKNKLTILHCVSLYPCPINKTNLNRIVKLKKRFKMNIGYSDHCKGINASLTAISLGANTIEKHFTDNKKAKGSDHEISADYLDLKKIVDFAKNFETLKGLGNIEPTKVEKKMKKFFRKSIYYKKDFSKNHILKRSDILIRRPMAFYEPKHLGMIINKRLKQNVYFNAPIKKKEIV